MSTILMVRYRRHGEPTRRGDPGARADLCLNFANTRYWRGSETPTEELSAPDDLLRWVEKARTTAGGARAALDSGDVR